MVHWAWLVAAFFGGSLAGLLTLALLASAKDEEEAYQAGYDAGYKKVFEYGRHTGGPVDAGDGKEAA